MSCFVQHMSPFDLHIRTQENCTCIYITSNKTHAFAQMTLNEAHAICTHQFSILQFANIEIKNNI